VIRANLYGHGGYGQLAEWTGRELESHGIPVAYDPIAVIEEFIPLQAFVRDRLIVSPVDNWELLLSTPSTKPMPNKNSVFFSMWETTGINRTSVSNLNQSKFVIVPCKFNRDTFFDCGVNVPIDIVPLGVDGDKWTCTDMPRYPSGDTVFVTAARHSHGGVRKNTIDMARAFCEAFPKGDEPVQFRIKCFTDCQSHLDNLPRDKRIRVYKNTMTDDQLVDWCKESTVGVFCSRGEGWGMHIHQFLSIGRPVITCFGSAMNDYCNRDVAFPVEFKWEKARDCYEDSGSWMVPLRESMISTFQYVFNNRCEVQKMSGLCAVKAREFTWKTMGNKLVETLKMRGLLKEIGFPDV
jgi:glycosyltransferase involved in cell wall biosynthesis